MCSELYSDTCRFYGRSPRKIENLYINHLRNHTYALPAATKTNEFHDPSFAKNPKTKHSGRHFHKRRRLVPRGGVAYVFATGYQKPALPCPLSLVVSYCSVSASQETYWTYFRIARARNMRLLTHNMLQCPRTKEYPLELHATNVDDVEVEYSREFVLRMLPRLDWNVFWKAADALGVADLSDALPKTVPDENTSDDILRKVHNALMEWHVVEGTLTSPSGQMYIISAGIPNLIISDAGDKCATLGASSNEGEKSGDNPGSGVRNSDDQMTT